MVVVGVTGLAISLLILVVAWRYYRLALRAKLSAMTQAGLNDVDREAIKRSLAVVFDESIEEALGNEADVSPDAAARVRLGAFRIAGRKIKSNEKLGETR